MWQIYLGPRQINTSHVSCMVWGSDKMNTPNYILAAQQPLWWTNTRISQLQKTYTAYYFQWNILILVKTLFIISGNPYYTNQPLMLINFH